MPERRKMADIFHNTEPFKLTVGVKITNAEEYEKLVDDARQKYEAFQEAVKQLNDFQLECEIG